MDALLQRISAQFSLWDNPWFEALRKDGGLSDEDFAEVQIQWLSLARGWDRPLAALCGRLPFPRQRRAIARGAWDGPTEEDAFLTLLESLGVDEAAADRRFRWPEVVAFETTLLGACAAQDWRFGAACLGMVERMLGDACAWTTAHLGEDAPYYAAQARWKSRQSEALLELVRDRFADGVEARYPIALGLRVGALEVTRLFESLWSARERRIFVR